MMVWNVIVILLGLYCVLESISAAGEMNKGDRLCRIGKYMLAGASGLYCVLIGMHSDATFGLALLIAAVALGIWPRMIYRITGCRRGTDFKKDAAQ